MYQTRHFPDGTPDHEAAYVGQAPVEAPAQLHPKSSAAQHAARVREDAAKEHDEILNQLQAERKRRRAERAKTAGLTTAEILAANARRS